MESAHRVRGILSFVQAADSGSFAGAARVLGLSAAAVSKNVAGLEGALGVRLMNRTTRSLNLTEEGVAFLEQARIALEALDAAVDSAAARRVSPSGRIRISTSLAFGRELLMPLLPGLLTRHPGLSVDIDFDDRVVDLVRDGYDFALRGGRIPDSALASRTICRLGMVLVASPNYLLAHGTPQKPEDLAGHKLIARRFLGGRVDPWPFMSGAGPVNIDPSTAAVLTTSAPEAVVLAARDGIGIGQAGLHLVWRHLQAGELTVVLPDVHVPGDYELVLQYPHRALMAPRVRVTLDYLVEGLERNAALRAERSSLGQLGQPVML